jgi:hypothetical protein
MRKKDLIKVLDKKSTNKKSSVSIIKPKHSLSQIEFDVRNPLEESKYSNSRIMLKYSGIGEEDCDEIMDEDEGIINRGLPLNLFNH